MLSHSRVVCDCRVPMRATCIKVLRIIGWFVWEDLLASLWVETFIWVEFPSHISYPSPVLRKFAL